MGLSSARSRLAAAERKGLLLRHRLLAGEPALYELTRAGRRAIGAPACDPCRVGAANAAHLIACAGVAAALECRYEGHVVLGERELRRRAQHGCGPAACVRLGRDLRGAPLLHRADLLLVPPAEERSLAVAIEVELTRKSPRRLEAICRAWARSRDLAGVVYLAAPGVEAAVERAVTRADAASKIVVLALESLQV